MNAYQPRPESHAFLLLEVLRAREVLAELPALAEHAEPALLRQVIEEAGRFVGEVLSPLNREGDEVGAQWKDGAVTMPPGFRDAYQAFWRAGWPSLACAVEDGGQGLPTALEAVLHEMLNAANHGWTMAPSLLHGAYQCLKHHGSEEIQARYLEKIATGEWLATMCLTEPQAGSDLGLVRTKATPLADGRFALSGTKIFISGGEHDLSDNIVHLVLARLPDAPPGPRGLSLFVVPKFDDGSEGRRAGPPQARQAPSGGSEPHEVGSVGVRTRVHCDRIEEKMGLHASPTCVLRFDEAVASLVGEPGKGLNAMFVMMNAARLLVGLQGIGLLDAALQKASAYAQERHQMRAPGSASKAGEADAIALHPAMQRILLTQRAWIDTGRVLAYRTALELDIQKHHPDAARRESAARWCSLVTPVLKSAWTEQAFTGASACLQVFGGHGYVREWGIEQHVRDARVAMIYEGTNEIQAIDLLIRKTLPDGAAALVTLLSELECDLEGLSTAAAAREALQHFSEFVREQLLPQTATASAPPDCAHWLADDFLRAFALVLMAWAGARIEATSGTSEAPAAFRRFVWPEFDLRLRLMRSTLGIA